MPASDMPSSETNSIRTPAQLHVTVLEQRRAPDLDVHAARVLGQALTSQRALLARYELAERLHSHVKRRNPRRLAEQRPRTRIAVCESGAECRDVELGDEPRIGRAKGAPRVALYE
eukprot:2530987-Pleurochrysis_carterae.AAC.3